MGGRGGGNRYFKGGCCLVGFGLTRVTVERRRMITSRRLWGIDYERFRALLIAARESAGMTQHEAADRLGRSQSFVAKSETGERRVDIVELWKFARLYGKPLGYFAPWTE